MTRSSRTAAALAAGIVALAGCGGGESGSREGARPASARQAQETALFAYDRSRPLALRDRGPINRGYPIKVHDVSFASPRGGRVPAYLILPPGNGPYPAVVYMHGSGGSRLDLVALGTWLAARRAVALTVQSPFERSRARVGAGLAALRKERDLVAQNVVELRRAVDFLETLPQVDASRIGFVGYSAGARTGAIVAGLERRIDAFVLMAGGAPRPGQFARLAPSARRPAVARILSDTDPARYLRAARGAAFLFQNGRRDEVVPRAALERLVAAAPARKEVRWYDAGHGLSAQAFRDQLEWLAGTLRITGPRVEGALAGP